ncbi:hypothetical protein BH10ACT3_BH10ACT3_05820 [soil metagenome]
MAIVVVLFGAGGWLVVDAFVFSRGDAATESLPPSERGAAPTTSVPAAVAEPNTQTEAARGDEKFAELDCAFTGRSSLDPSLDMADPLTGSRHVMALDEGARFECSDGIENSSGTVSLDATFEDLSALSGVASGTGRIEWDLVPIDEQVPPGQLSASNTAVEVQLDYPVIVVWTTIVDGPYTGYHGKLVLREWERLYDDDGRVNGIDFASTNTKFTPA